MDGWLEQQRGRLETCHKRNFTVLAISVAEQAGLCMIWTETQKTGFFTSWPI